jgi:MerR family redox-sensitive transcriptional activator SoxR
MSEALLPIDRVAKESGVASSALRYYERCGLILEGVKIAGRRHYEPAVLRRLAIIKTCQTIGFSLSEIAMLLGIDTGHRPAGGVGADVEGGQPEASWQQLVMTRRALVLQHIQQLRNVLELLDKVMMCSCHELRDCPRLLPDGDLSRLPDHHRRAAGETWRGPIDPR